MPVDIHSAVQDADDLHRVFDDQIEDQVMPAQQLAEFLPLTAINWIAQRKIGQRRHTRAHRGEQRGAGEPYAASPKWRCMKASQSNGSAGLPGRPSRSAAFRASRRSFSALNPRLAP